jgi:integrase
MPPTKTRWPRTIKSGSASVKVYRNVHESNASGWTYILAWATPTGRKREKFADEKTALAEASLKAAQLSHGRIEGADMTSSDRAELQAARKLTGNVPLLSALSEWTKATQLTTGNVLAAAKAWAQRNGKVAKRVLVSDVVKEFLKVKSAAGKNVANDHRHSFKVLAEVLGEFSIDTVSARQIDAWLAKTENPVTRNTRRKRVVSVWRWAQRKGYLPRDARTEAEMTERAHEPAPAIGIIGVSTWRTLLEDFRANDAKLVPALVLAGFCGMRRGEIHGQTWEDISLERKNLRVSAVKRGTPARRMVPLCDAAVDWLLLCENRKGPVCEGLAMDAIRKVAIAKKHPLPENCFRHSYISHAVAATGDIPRVSLDAGNSPKEINRHYRELVTEAEGEAWFDSAPAKVGELIEIRSASGT